MIFGHSKPGKKTFLSYSKLILKIDKIQEKIVLLQSVFKLIYIVGIFQKAKAGDGFFDIFRHFHFFKRNGAKNIERNHHDKC